MKYVYPTAPRCLYFFDSYSKMRIILVKVFGSHSKDLNNRFKLILGTFSVKAPIIQTLVFLSKDILTAII